LDFPILRLNTFNYGGFRSAWWTLGLGGRDGGYGGLLLYGAYADGLPEIFGADVGKFC